MTKKNMIFTASAFIFLILAVLIFSVNGLMKQTGDVKNFMDHVINQEFEKASDYIAFYNEAPDESVRIPKSQAKKIWTVRIKSAQENGLFIKQYHNLRTWEEDGYPVGEIDLVISSNGETQTYNNVEIHYIKRENEWKIGYFEYQPSEPGKPWEKIISGEIDLSSKQ